MKASSLAGKTIRPGSLNGFSYYYSGQRATTGKKKPTKKALAEAAARRARRRKLFGLILLIVIALPLAAHGLQSYKSAAPKATPIVKTHTATPASKPTPTPAPVVVAKPIPTDPCANNELGQLIKVSISQRHLWACQAGSAVYDSPVITGIEYLAADLTPRGTYHIYSRQTNLTLTGSDSTGSWSDPVSYWLPFLSNKYGVYGFHDATWRADSEFGNVDPNTANASHGCVELPLASAARLYSWARVGTTLTISS